MEESIKARCKRLLGTEVTSEHLTGKICGHDGQNLIIAVTDDGDSGWHEVYVSDIIYMEYRKNEKGYWYIDEGYGVCD